MSAEQRATPGTGRREFLILSAGGAAAVAAGVDLAAPAAAPAAPGRDRSRRRGGSLVAHVHDLHGDTVSLLVGEEEVVVHDADLVARLARAAR